MNNMSATESNLQAGFQLHFKLLYGGEIGDTKKSEHGNVRNPCLALDLPVDGQRKCPAKWPAKMSLVLLAMITDGSYSTRSRFMGGLRVSMYFFAVSRWMPSSRATPRIDNPLRFAF